jgi:hypothetical protein
MPANPNSPFGFKFIKMVDGFAPTYGARKGYIHGGSGGNTNSIFSGDPLTVSSGGYLSVFTAALTGTTLVAGFADWFTWVSIAQQKTVRQLYWPGTPTDTSGGGDIDIEYYGNSNMVFEVQCLLGPVTIANVGQYANWNVGAGGKTVGLGNYSSFTLDDGTLSDTRGTTPQLPLRVYDVPGVGPQSPLYNQAGYDPTQAYNRVWVTLASFTPE